LAGFNDLIIFKYSIHLFWLSFHFIDLLFIIRYLHHLYRDIYFVL